MPNNDAIPMNVVEVLASAELSANDNSESVAMSVAEGGAGSSRKADKVSGATAGNLAGLDATGNLTDSGKKPADFVAAENFYATQLPMSSTDPTTVAEKATDLLSQIDQKASIIHETVSNVAIASVPDGAANLPLSSLVIGIDPVQDLHGQDAPYPAGGGKNLYNGKYVDSVYFNESDVYSSSLCPGNNAMPIIPGNKYTASINGVISGIRYVFLDEEKTAIGSLANADTTDTAPENAKYLRWRIRANAVENEKYQIEVGTTASAWSPHSNICPITGWTGCNIEGPVRNLLNIDSLISASQGVIGSYLFKHRLTLTLEPNTDYTLMTSYDETNNVLYFNGATASDAVKKSAPKTRTADSSGQLVIGLYDRTGIEEFENKTVFIVLVKTSENRTYPISWQTEAGTVYGGTIDPVNGEMVVEYVKKTITEFSGAFGAVTNGYCVYALISDTTHDTSIVNAEMMRSNIFKYSSESRGNAPLWTYGLNAGEDSTQAFILPPTITSLNDANQWLSNLGYDLECIFRLATPIEIPLSDVPQISTLLGVNNLWADTGNILLMEYGCDTKGYIDKKLAELTALILENN